MERIELFEVWTKEGDEWVKAAKLYPSASAAKRDAIYCGYAPDEFKIIKVEKEM